jgi:hypothetical protein
MADARLGELRVRPDTRSKSSGTPHACKRDETLRVLGFSLVAAGILPTQNHYVPCSEPRCKNFTAVAKRAGAGNA